MEVLSMDSRWMSIPISFPFRRWSMTLMATMAPFQRPCSM